jgi:hypothetical protein
MSIDRPKFLSNILDTAREISTEEKQLFIQFLTDIEEAQRQSFHLQTSCSLKLSFKVLNDDSAPVMAENSSLRLMFDFYAKLAQPSLTFTKYGESDAIDLSNTTLEFHEFMFLLRDFKIIPNLINKEDLQFLWKVTRYESWICIIIHFLIGNLNMS